MKLIIPILVMLSAIACSPKKTATTNLSLVGKWSHTHSHDDKTYHDFIAYFKTDGTYDGIEDGKATITGGRYQQNNDTVILNDPSCNPHPVGIYKVVIYAGDSLRFDVISDSCDARRNGTEPFRFKRLKS